MRLIRDNRKLEAFETAFKILFLVYLALGSCSLTYGKSYISIVMYAALLFGAAVLLLRVLDFKAYLPMTGLICAVLMWLSYALSCAVNLQYFTKNGVVYAVLWMLYFFGLYAQRSDRTTSELKKEFHLIAALYVVWISLLVYISIWMLFSGYVWAYKDPNNANYEVAAGFFSGRLWGAFQDPNHGAVMCCVAMAISLYVFLQCKKVFPRVLLVLNALLMLFYMAMSDSRNGMVCMGVLCAVSAAFLWFPKRRGKKNAAIGAALVCVLLVCGVFAPKLVQKGYNAAVTMQAQVQEPTVGSSTGTAAGKKDEHLDLVDRGYDINQDFSNRRTAIWKSGLEIGTSKILTGVSFVGAVPYAKEHLPTTYIVSNDYWTTNTFENEIINLYVAQGLPAVLILLAWFVLILRCFVKNIGKADEKDMRLIAVLTTICTVLMASAMFQGTMFYQVTTNSGMFWISAGSLLLVLHNCSKEKV